MQNIQRLPLVTVNALDLAVENGMRVELLPHRPLDIGGEPLFVRQFHQRHFLGEDRIVRPLREPQQIGGMRHPALADRFADDAGQFRVRLHQPAPVGNAVGFVAELARRILIKSFQNRFFQDFRVDFRHAVDAVTADHRKIGHVNEPVGDDRHFPDAVPLARIAVP